MGKEITVNGPNLLIKKRKEKTCGSTRGDESHAKGSQKKKKKAIIQEEWLIWLRHCATSRKVAGSIPDGVIGIFH